MYPNPSAQQIYPPPYTAYPSGNDYPPQPAINPAFQYLGGPGGEYPPQGYPQPAPQGYPPPATQGYPPPSGPGYPPAGPIGYPPTAGYPPAPQGYPPAQGYGPQGAAGVPPPNTYPPPGGVGAPISTQPTAADGWMSLPQVMPVNCPPGLEYLTTIDQLLVHQKVEILEAFTGFETKNKYTIKNSVGQKVFYSVEDSGCLTRCCCGTMRPFDMKILDNYKNEVIHLYRPLACQSCFFPCCLQSMEVFSPVGSLIGSVQQDWSIFAPQFSVKNAAGDTVLKIEGPFCTYSICGDVEFKVLSNDGSRVVGKISKQWSGLLREALTDADFFGITFPMDLDVKMKAVMLGACFLIDFMFFEKKGNKEEDGFGMC